MKGCQVKDSRVKHSRVKDSQVKGSQVKDCQVKGSQVKDSKTERTIRTGECYESAIRRDKTAS